METKDELKGLSLRSEEIQEIMSRPPHWTLRWGITVVAVIVGAMLFGSYFIRYEEKVPVTVVMENHIPVVSITVPTDGTLQRVHVKNGESITCDDTLFTYYPKQIDSKETDDSLCTILCPTNGVVSFPYPRNLGMPLKAKSLFMDIVPDKVQDLSMHTYGFLSESERDKVSVGQTVCIPIHDDILLGTIGSISPLPNDKGLYYFDIVLSPKSEELIMDRNTPFHKEQSAEIIISNPRLIYKIFALFTHW